MRLASSLEVLSSLEGLKNDTQRTRLDFPSKDLPDLGACMPMPCEEKRGAKLRVCDANANACTAQHNNHKASKSVRTGSNGVGPRYLTKCLMGVCTTDA